MGRGAQKSSTWLTFPQWEAFFWRLNPPSLTLQLWESFLTPTAAMLNFGALKFNISPAGSKF